MALKAAERILSEAANAGGSGSHEEGPLARTIESQTARLPSDLFLWGAFGSMAVSLAMQLTGRKHESLFIGQWAPSLLLMGVYNKIVKVGGSDRFSR